MALADSVEKGLSVVILVLREVEHLIEAELVKGDRVERGGHTDVLDGRPVRIAVTVAVYRKVVEDINVDDALLGGEIVVDGLSGGSHRFDERSVALRAFVPLLRKVLPQKMIVLSLAGSVDVRLAVSGSDTDGGVLQRTAESSHRVSLEVRQVDHKIVIGEV